MSKVIVVTREDKQISLEEWQEKYGLLMNSAQIGRNFSYKESKFQEDIKNYGVLYVNELLIRVLDAARDKWGKPLIVNSFNRNAEKQAELKAQGLKAATYSPHVVYLAADIDTKTPEESRKLAKVIRAAAESIGIKVRLGFEQYIAAGQTFVHVDVCPEYYAKGKPRAKQEHPTAWESPINW
jgi:hypothetical protein